MSTDIHKDARRPDVVTEQLKKGFEWTTGHSKIAAGALGVVALILAVIFGGRAYTRSQEAKLQTELYAIEKAYLAKKESFDTYERLKTNPPKAGEAAPADKGTAPTGQLEQDYGDLVTKLRAFAEQHPKAAGGAMAALYLAEIQAKYGKGADALETLKKISYDDGLVGALVQNRTASVLADQKDCPGAIAIWEKLVKNSSASFLHPEAKLRIGMCAEANGDAAKAEALYKEVTASAKESGQGRLAEQFLRRLRLK